MYKVLAKQHLLVMHYIPLFFLCKLTFKGQDSYLAEGEKGYCLLPVLKDDVIISNTPSQITFAKTGC